MALLSGPSYDYDLGLVALTLALTLALALALALLARTIHSVYLGPLAKFPGPKLAAATLLYEFYYDVILKGQYTWKIKELHQQYGPIIRISPYELHIDDPDYYEELYSLHQPRNRYKWFVAQFGLPDTVFAAVDWKLHRARRAAMSPFFSKTSVNKLEPMLSHMIEKLCRRIDQYRESGQPMPIRQLYSCLTTDVITLYAMNRSWNYLDSPDLSLFWVETMQNVVRLGAIVKYFPWVMTIVEALPLNVIRALDPGTAMILDFRKKVRDDTQSVIDGTFKHSQQQVELGMDKTIIHELLESDLPPEEKTHARIWQEGQIVIGAGADTTANTLTVTHFHILDNPEVRRKLEAELKTALPDEFTPANLKMVEKLPYLCAVVQEGLRLSYGVVSRLQRSHPTEIMTFQGWEIPPNTPVGMTSVHIHESPSIFPDPLKFRPERWLEKRPEGAPPLDRYLVSFTKGSRQCLGINLARAELYMTLATVFRRFDNQELFDSSRFDVDVKHDYLLPQIDKRSKGVKVLFK